VTEAASPRSASPSGHPDSPTDWHHAVELLNFTTSEEATIAFERGDVAGAREFVWQPMAAFVQALLRGSEPRRFSRAVIAGYTLLVRAAKLWEIEMGWRRQNLASWSHGRFSAVVRREWRDSLEAVLAGAGDAVVGGRGATRRMTTGRGSVIVRRFRRGGAMRWLGRRYFGFRPRPLREFAVLLRARRRRLPVPEPIAAVVERRWGFGYHGALVMSEISGGVPLLEFLRARPEVDIAPALATGLRRLHDAGLRHPDLNLGNVLALDAEGGPSVAFVDLDRARLTDGPLDPRARKRSLRRLRRSARKLDPDGGVLSAGSLERVEAIYWRAEPREE
jgi:3-deoxy-D-manno-octulosonic acid kinase